MTRAWAGKRLPGKWQEQKPGPSLSVSIRHKNALYKNCLYPANGILARAPSSQAKTDDRETEAWMGGQTHGQPIKSSSFHTIFLQIGSYFFRHFKSLFWVWRQNRSILRDSQVKCPFRAAGLCSDTGISIRSFFLNLHPGVPLLLILFSTSAFSECFRSLIVLHALLLGSSTSKDLSERNDHGLCDIDVLKVPFITGKCWKERQLIVKLGRWVAEGFCFILDSQLHLPNNCSCKQHQWVENNTSALDTEPLTNPQADIFTSTIS